MKDSIDVVDVVAVKGPIDTLVLVDGDVVDVSASSHHSPLKPPGHMHVNPRDPLPEPTSVESSATHTPP